MAAPAAIFLGLLHDMRISSPVCERVLRGAFAAFLGLLFWVPLPLASNRTWALGFLAAAMLALLLVVCVVMCLGGFDSLRKLRSASLPLAGLAGYAIWLTLQWSGAVPDVASRDPFNTLQYLLLTLTYLGAFALILLLADSAARVKWVLGAMVATGLLQALVAIGLFASHAKHIYLFMPYEQGSRAMGTFANFDHLAGFMELCLAAGVGLMLATMEPSESRRPNRRQRLVALLKFMMSGKMLVRLMLVVMVIALVLTRSRMGNMAFFTSLLLVGGAAVAFNARLRRGAFWLVASLIVVDVIVVGQWVGIDQVVARLQNTAVVNEHARGEETVEQRADTPRQALALVKTMPLAGYGAGSFYSVFPRFKSEDKEGYWDHAHNDYVQIAGEAGLVGFGLLAAVVLASLWRLMRFWRKDESRLNRGVAFGVSMAVCALLIHSWVDFNLQIPANALYFCVFLSLVWVLEPRVRAVARGPSRLAGRG